MAYRSLEVGRKLDRERFRKRTAERAAQGLCPRCGQRPPAPGRTVCAICAEKRNRASRARDARLRAEGKPRRDPAKAREAERRRHRRQAAERRAAGSCVRCGQAPAAPGRSLCEGCGAQRREAERNRYAKASNAGVLYGGRDPAGKRRSARAASRKRQEARLAAGQCTRCGRRPPVEGGTACEPCRQARRAADRELYEARRAAGLCGRCGGSTTDGGSRCAPCAVIEPGRNQVTKNEAARRRYTVRRSRDACTDCAGPAYGACRCPDCAKRSYERSDHFRGLPLYPPSFTVIELETGECHGSFGCEADVALCVAFAKLSRDQVEIISDVSPIARFAAWA